jgi:hypothetical protein
MADYSLAFQQATVTTAYKTAGLIAVGANNGAVRRLRLFEFSIGQGTPNATDSALQWDVSRQTSSGTATATTPSPIDEADAACTAGGFSNFTAEPTYAAAGAGLSLWNDAINQRAAYRWIAKDGKELVVSAVTSHGLGLRTQALTASGYASLAGGVCHFTE